MADLCNQSSEHGVNVWLLEDYGQRREAGQTVLPTDVLQPSVSEAGKLSIRTSWSTISHSVLKQTTVPQECKVLSLLMFQAKTVPKVGEQPEQSMAVAAPDRLVARPKERQVCPLLRNLLKERAGKQLTD